MQASDLMTRDVRTCAPGDNLAEAVNSIWEADCGVLPVVDADGKLAGILTDRDIAIAVGTRNRKASEIHVRDVMTRDVKSCTPDTDLAGVVRAMQRARVRRMPVVDDAGRVAGILTLNDLLMAAEPATGLDDVVETLRIVNAPWRHANLQVPAPPAS